MTKKEKAKIIATFKIYQKCILSLMDLIKIPGAGTLFADFLNHPEKYTDKLVRPSHGFGLKAFRLRKIGKT
jgi:hypothetical protein